MNNRSVDLKSVTFSHGKFSISAEEAKQIAVNEIKSFFALENLSINEKGYLSYWVKERNDMDEIVVRKASSMDKKVLEVLKEMNKAGYTCESD